MSKNKIDSISKDKTDKFPEYVKKWVDIGLSTDPCDVISAVESIKKSYEVVNLDPPEYFIGPVNSPYEGTLAQKIIEEFVENEIEFSDAQHLNDLVMGEVNKRKNNVEKLSIIDQMYGCAEYWLGFYDFWQNEYPEIEGLDIINPIKELSNHIGWWTPLKNIAILQHRPLEIHRNSRNQLHNPNGPALRYRGDCKVSNLYRVNGVTVPKSVIDRNFSAKDIESEQNVEVRRVMIDFYGQEKFLQETNAEEVHTDEFGTLYKKELIDDEPIMMVKVVNSTPEPDGTFKDYFIRVDPNAYGGIKTARAAVASTWRDNDGSMIFKNPEDYDCSIET